MRKSKLCAFFLSVALAAVFGAAAYAAPVAVPASPAAPCAVVSDFGGQVEIIDPTRTRLTDATIRVAVPCDGWVSVKSGWVKLRHRDGFVLQASAETFFSLPEPGADDAARTDQVVVLKGQLYAEAADGAGELRVVTANGRAVFNRASGIILYSQDEDESQLIALRGASRLQNRFEPTASLKIQAGEASTLNPRVLRLTPSAPKAVSLASLRPKLQELHVGETASDGMLANARARGDRKFATWLVPKEDESGVPTQVQGRMPASRTTPEIEKISFERAPTPETVQKYARHPASADDPKLRTHLTRKLVADQEVGEKILFPDKFYGRPQKVKLVVVQPVERQSPGQDEKAEKARLIEELSQIRAE